MSHEAVMWALRQDATSTEKFVLMLLAERSNHEGVSWPGYNNIAELTSFTPRTVKRACSALVERGLVEIHERYAQNGRQTSNLYLLRLDRGRALSEILSHEQSWRAARAGQLALIAEEAPEGRVTHDHPPSKSPPQTVDNPVDKTPDLSTGVTHDHPQGDTRSPSGGDTRSPLEPETNQDLVANTVSSSGEAVDNECGALARADTNTLAPDGAKGAEVRQEGGAPLAMTHPALRERYAQIDTALHKHFGDLWTQRQRRPGRQLVWLEAIARLSAMQLARGIHEATQPSMREPPSAYKFVILAMQPDIAPAPPTDRSVGRTALRRLAGTIPGYHPRAIRSPDHGET